MVKKCIICRIKPDETCGRTFHKFPKGLDIRQKWLNALKITKSPNFKTAFVCSDHFEKRAFTRPYNQTLKMRLFSDSIPRLMLNNQELEGVNVTDASVSDVVVNNVEKSANVTPEQTILNNDSGAISMSGKIDTSIEPKVENVSLEEEKSINGSPGCEDVKMDTNTVNNKNMEPNSESNNDEDSRKSPRPLSPNSRPKKRIRFIINYKTEHISRADFVSDESWEKFLRFISYEKSKKNAAYSRTSRKKKKVTSLQNIVKLLKKRGRI